MNITFINLTRKGGQVHYLVTLANAFVDSVNVSVVSSSNIHKKYFDTSINLKGFNTGTKKSDTLIKLLNPRTYYQLYELIHNTYPDIIYVTGPHEWNLIITILIKLFIHKPIVATLHNPFSLTGTPFYFNIIEYSFRKLVYYWVVHTDHAFRSLDDIGLGSNHVLKLQMGAFGLFNNYYDPKIKKENRILFFGRIEPYKGLDTLEEVAQKILAHLPEWKITIAGSGNIAQYKKLLSSKRIEILNYFLTDQEVANLFQATKIIILPYESASFSGIPLIAGLFSIPIVSSNVGGLPEFVIHGITGLVIPPNDPNALFNSIISLSIDNQHWEKLSIGNKNQYTRKWAWNKISPEYVEYFKFIIEATKNKL